MNILTCVSPSTPLCWVILGLAIAILIFWLWMFIDMLSSERIKKQTKGLWTILFLIVPISALIWLIVRK